MDVRFGLQRDTHDPAPDEDAVGAVTVGPRGLLRLLERDLGIAEAVAHPAEALALYRGCLAECDDLTRFYRASFQVDPVGVARTLFDWRAEWYLHGWDGTAAPDAPNRVADMAAVERLARARMPAGTGQRLARVLGALDGARTQIRTLALLDHYDDLPRMWQRLARRLGARHTFRQKHTERDWGV